MDLDLTDEQVLLQDSLRRMLQDKCSTKVVRQMEGDPKGYPDALWNAVIEMGLPGLTIAEEFGGLGAGAIDLAILYEELGRALAPIPHFVSCVLSAGLIDKAGSGAQKAEWLSAIANGKALVTPAWLEPGNSFSARGVQMGGASHDGYRLNGKKFMVPFAAAADRLIVLVRSGTGPEDIDLVLVDPKTKGVSMRHQKTMSQDAEYEIAFENVAAPASARLGAAKSGWRTFEDVLKSGMIALAAWSVGCGTRALEMATAYAKERVQFDKPIGSFQAIAHPLVNVATILAGARLLTWEASWAHDAGRPFAQLATMAYLEGAEAARQATAAGHQTFGGIGFTNDIDMQLFFRRAKQGQLAWGDVDALNEEVGAAALVARP